MLVLLQVDTVAGDPLKVTVLPPWVAPKPDPPIVRDVPATPFPITTHEYVTSQYVVKDVTVGPPLGVISSATPFEV
jgi:hypothetical protein